MSCSLHFQSPATIGSLDLGGTASWTNRPNVFSTGCRQDLAKLLSSNKWDGWLSDRIQNHPDSCKAQDVGVAEIQVGNFGAC